MSDFFKDFLNAVFKLSIFCRFCSERIWPIGKLSLSLGYFFGALLPPVVTNFCFFDFTRTVLRYEFSIRISDAALKAWSAPWDI